MSLPWPFDTKLAVWFAKKTACECYLDIWEQGQGHLLTIDFSFSTQLLQYTLNYWYLTLHVCEAYMKLHPGIANQVSGIFLFWTIQTNFLCWYKCNLYYGSALDCYRGLCNLGHCFSVKYLVDENLAFALHCGASS